ncbi:MAG: zinc metalloprotease [Pseudomonadota bacterium]|jgi:regulator of sigma E protease
MTVMNSLTTVLAFLVTLGLLVVIHEYAHYRVAVACGVRVLRFSLGFGPVLWRFQRTPQSTEVVLSAFPLGGYVSMLEVPSHPGEAHQAFTLKPLWQRAAVVAAGPVSNLLLAVLLYSGAHWVGMEEPRARLGMPIAQSLAESAGLRSGDVVEAFSTDGEQWEDLLSMADLRWEITQAVLNEDPLHLRVSQGEGRAPRTVVLAIDTLGTRDIDAQTMRRIGIGAPAMDAHIGRVIPGGAAAVAGLTTGDRVTSIDGVLIDDAAQALELVRGNVASAPMQWQVLRAGQSVALSVTPVPTDDNGKTVGRIGAHLGSKPELVMVSYGPWEGFTKAVERTWSVSKLTVKMLWRIVTLQASPKNISGPLTMADYAGQSARMGLAVFLGYLAVVSVSLGVLNLLPLPMLDGGHLMYYLFEAVTGRPLSDAWRDRLQRGGFAILVLLMSLAFYNDVVRYLGPQ